MALPTVTTLIVVLVILVIVITAIYWGSPVKDHPKLSGYISILGIVSLLVLALGLLISVHNHHRNERNNVIGVQTRLSEKYWHPLEDKFAATPELRRLYKQIYSDNAAVQTLPDLELTPEVEEQEIHMAMKLFQMVEDIITQVAPFPKGLHSPEFEGWDNTFRSWFKSSILQDQWLYNKMYFDTATQRVIEQYIGR